MPSRDVLDAEAEVASRGGGRGTRPGAQLLERDLDRVARAREEPPDGAAVQPPGGEDRALARPGQEQDVARGERLPGAGEAVADHLGIGRRRRRRHIVGASLRKRRRAEQLVVVGRGLDLEQIAAVRHLLEARPRHPELVGGRRRGRPGEPEGDPGEQEQPHGAPAPSSTTIR
jgi:hypothetical protein